ncbi:MAG: collagen binding domain-containing protein [Aristaeellaceae bacterium]
MKNKNRKQYEEVGYWESMSDVMTGLLLCVLLVVLLLILYLIRIPDEEHVDTQFGDSYADYYDPDDGGGNWGYPYVIDDDKHEDYPYRPDYKDNESGGGGGTGDGDGDTDGEHEKDYDFEDPDPGIGEGLGLDKTAIFVQIVDGETQSTIKRKGVTYELYSSDDTLQTLSTYYPAKTDYTKYETNADGVFFLPEKIALGSYYLHGLTAVPGYEITDKAAFTVDESRDWSYPYVVTVELYPARNVIRIQMRDRDTGRTVSGGAFNIIAQTDIITLDGTLRFQAGQIVDTVTLDESGYGESRELYMGEYRLVQTVTPEYYAALDESPLVTVQQSSRSGKSATTTISAQRTTMRVTLADALYPAMGLSGATFTLSTGDGTVLRTLTTDAHGQMLLNELQANTTYRLRQTGAGENYTMDLADHTFRVDSRGLIDGEPTAEMRLTNSIVRVAIGVRGKLVSGLVSDESVALYDSEGNLLKIWTSSALEQELEGLAPGEYRLVFNGSVENGRPIIVRQTHEMQHFYLQIWTRSDITMVLIASTVAVGLVALAIVLLVMRRKRKRALGETNDTSMDTEN